MSEWQPIETAPKGGTVILLFLDPPLNTNHTIGWCRHGALHIVTGWAEADYQERGASWMCGFCEDGTADTDGYGHATMIHVKPTHWMPLPAPPF